MTGTDTTERAMTVDPRSQKLDASVIGTAVVVIIGSFMSLLDSTIVNVAIDSLSRSFAAPLSTIQWVTTGYVLALAAVVPLTGWASARFGTKRLYIASIAVFTLASVLAGLSWSPGSLIAFRVLQGLGGGMLMPAGTAMMARAAGPARLGRAMGIVGVPMLLGPVLGPVLGGWLLGVASWRWIFFINAPIGVLGVLLGVRLLARDVITAPPRIDWLGVSLLSPGIVGFIFGLSRIEVAGFTSPTSWIPALAGLLLIAVFVWHSLHATSPLLELKLLRHRAMAAASATNALQGLAFNSAMFLLPLYFQVGRQQSPFLAGMLIAPLGLGAAAMQSFAGRLTDRVPAGRVVLAGMVPFGAGLIAMTTVSAHTPLWLIAIYVFVIGVGAGMTQMPVMTAGLRTVPPEDSAHASTVLNIVTRCGAAIGVAVVAIVLARNLNAPIADAAHSPTVGAAFASTFWWPAGFVLLAVVASLFLPLRRSAHHVPLPLDEGGSH